jgi:hypothetical protein
MNKVDYSTLIDVEKAILKLDRLQRKVDKVTKNSLIYLIAFVPHSLTIENSPISKTTRDVRKDCNKD